MSFLEFVEGPLWYVAAVVFVVGVVWKLIGILLMGKKTDLSEPRGSAAAGAVRAIFLHFVPHGGFLGKTLFHFIAGYVFHLGLFATLIFAAPHMTFLSENVLGGATWATLPDWGFWLAGASAIGGFLLLWLYRAMDKVTSKIMDRGDRIVNWLTFLVMLTGCMAMAEASDALRAIHMLFADAWLIYFPFSRMMHAFTFIYTRGYMGANFGRRGVTP
jgi:hypothetical protein